MNELAVEQRLNHGGNDHIVIRIENANDLGHAQGGAARGIALVSQLDLRAMPPYAASSRPLNVREEAVVSMVQRLLRVGLSA